MVGYSIDRSSFLYAVEPSKWDFKIPTGSLRRVSAVNGLICCVNVLYWMCHCCWKCYFCWWFVWVLPNLGRWLVELGTLSKRVYVSFTRNLSVLTISYQTENHSDEDVNTSCIFSVDLVKTVFCPIIISTCAVHPILITFFESLVWSISFCLRVQESTEKSKL